MGLGGHKVSPSTRASPGALCSCSLQDLQVPGTRLCFLQPGGAAALAGGRRLRQHDAALGGRVLAGGGCHTALRG